MDFTKQEKGKSKMNVDTIQQTIKLVRTGDFEVLLPPSVSKRLFKVLDLDEFTE